jgi:3-hydroxybutyryl-CoA dehydrogenase
VAPADRVWVDRRDDAGRAVADRLARLGAALDEGTAPGPDSLVVLAPVGLDGSAVCAALGLAPERVVAIDPLFGLEAGRRTLMKLPGTDPIWRDRALALCAADGASVSLVADSPGCVVQRIVAAIVNLGCEIAPQGVAAPADIDDAVRLGLGYPLGPLTLGDRLGGDVVLRILENIHALSGDPRYRPSHWLRRRAKLGLSLQAV